MKRIIKLTFIGIMIGCTINVLLGIIFAIFTNPNTTLNINAKEYIIQSICSIITGIGFTLPSFVYDKENISLPLKLFIHMTIGFIIYILCAFKAKWIPLELGIIPVLSSFIVCIFIVFIIWFGFYLYYKKEAQNINKNLKEIKKEA